MAYSKKHTLSNGSAVSHYRVQAYRIDYGARDASAIVAAYADATNPEPVKPIFAKVRLTGEAFDRILGKAALAASDHDINAAFYLAMLDPKLVLSDAGADFFTDALEA